MAANFLSHNMEHAQYGTRLTQISQPTALAAIFDRARPRTTDHLRSGLGTKGGVRCLCDFIRIHRIVFKPGEL